MKEWFKLLGEKSSRTDVWVVLYIKLTIVSAFFFFACGTGFITYCSSTFITSNSALLITLVTGMMVDLGIKQWKNVRT